MDHPCPRTPHMLYHPPLPLGHPPIPHPIVPLPNVPGAWPLHIRSLRTSSTWFCAANVHPTMDGIMMRRGSFSSAKYDPPPSTSRFPYHNTSNENVPPTVSPHNLPSLLSRCRRLFVSFISPLYLSNDVASLVLDYRSPFCLVLLFVCFRSHRYNKPSPLPRQGFHVGFFSTERGGVEAVWLTPPNLLWFSCGIVLLFCLVLPGEGGLFSVIGASRIIGCRVFGSVRARNVVDGWALIFLRKL